MCVNDLTMNQGDIFYYFHLEDNTHWVLMRGVTHEQVRDERRFRFTWSTCGKIFCRPDSDSEHFFTEPKEAVLDGLKEFARQMTNNSIEDFEQNIQILADGVKFYKNL